MNAAGSDFAQFPANGRGGAMPTLTVIILTYNEERHIARAIASVRGIATDILVVDSFSQDRTVELAQGEGARVMANRFVNQAKQFQWALDNGDVRSEWILRLDADEVIEPDLAAELQRDLPTLPQDVVAVNFKRKHIFMERWIRHGGRYPLLLLRLWRNGHGRVEDRWMDEHIVTWGGRTITAKGGFADISLHDLSFFTDKHNKYATREALEILNARYGLFEKEQETDLGSRQARIKRFIKGNVYNRMPKLLAPTLLFTYRYIFQLGFLDGREGLIYHFLQGYWYRFLVAAKLFELEKGIAHCSTREERLRMLRELTGHDL
jgi:glycosyltransferase involved in cell wall biosynthesis